MTVTLYQGDCLEVMRTLPDGCVQCCVTSPPYFGLRDYQTATWEGGDAACDHVDPQGAVNAPSNKSTLTTNNGKGPQPGDKYHADRTAQYRDLCGKCGARRIDAQIGLEETPESYVARLVEVFREVKRLLHPTGTCWINLGDSYNGSNKGYMGNGEWADRSHAKQGTNVGALNLMPTKINGLKPKDLIGIPWLVAFALRADGWYLRSDLIWHKPNPMPESVTDRPTKSHEYIFLLSKSASYYYDADAIREPHKPNSLSRYEYGHNAPSDATGKVAAAATTGAFQSARMGDHVNPLGANRRSVWTVATQPYAEAHFATFPTALIEPCILAGSSAKGCCAACGSPWERVVERSNDTRLEPGGKLEELVRNGNRNDGNARMGDPTVTTLGWQPTCSCNADTVPCTVLDPFAGSGTTLTVALKHHRNAIGIELNESYHALMQTRIQRTQPTLLEVT